MASDLSIKRMTPPQNRSLSQESRLPSVSAPNRDSLTCSSAKTSCLVVRFFTWLAAIFSRCINYCRSKKKPQLREIQRPLPKLSDPAKNNPPNVVETAPKAVTVTLDAPQAVSALSIPATAIARIIPPPAQVVPLAKPVTILPVSAPKAETAEPAPLGQVAPPAAAAVPEKKPTQASAQATDAAPVSLPSPEAAPKVERSASYAWHQQLSSDFNLGLIVAAETLKRKTPEPAPLAQPAASISPATATPEKEPTPVSAKATPAAPVALPSPAPEAPRVERTPVRVEPVRSATQQELQGLSALYAWSGRVRPELNKIYHQSIRDFVVQLYETGKNSIVDPFNPYNPIDRSRMDPFARKPERDPMATQKVIDYSVIIHLEEGINKLIKREEELLAAMPRGYSVNTQSNQCLDDTWRLIHSNYVNILGELYQAQQKITHFVYDKDKFNGLIGRLEKKASEFSNFAKNRLKLYERLAKRSS